MRCSMSFVTFATGGLMVLALVSAQVSAQTFTTLHSFNGADGANPGRSLTVTPDGSTLYGTTYLGGGTIFSIPVGGGPLTTLASFNGPNGYWPLGGLTLSGSTLYGMTIYGGTFGYANGGSGYGTIFSIPVGGGTLTTLYSFDGTNGK